MIPCIRRRRFQPRYQKNVTAMWMIGTFDMLSARSPRDISAFAFIGVETKGPLHLFPLNTSGFFRGVRQQKWSAINLKAAKPVFANDFRALMLPPDATPSKKTKSYPFQITVAKFVVYFCISRNALLLFAKFNGRKFWQLSFFFWTFGWSVLLTFTHKFGRVKSNP